MDYRMFLEQLERRILQDETFFFKRQDELDIEDPEQKEIYEVTQGKIDMCQQILGYLERVRRHPEFAESAA